MFVQIRSAIRQSSVCALTVGLTLTTAIPLTTALKPINNKLIIWLSTNLSFIFDPNNNFTELCVALIWPHWSCLCCPCAGQCWPLARWLAAGVNWTPTIPMFAIWRIWPSTDTTSSPTLLIWSSWSPSSQPCLRWWPVASMPSLSPSERPIAAKTAFKETITTSVPSLTPAYVLNKALCVSRSPLISL